MWNSKNSKQLFYEKLVGTWWLQTQCSQKLLCIFHISKSGQTIFSNMAVFAVDTFGPGLCGHFLDNATKTVCAVVVWSMKSWECLEIIFFVMIVSLLECLCTPLQIQILVWFVIFTWRSNVRVMQNLQPVFFYPHVCKVGLKIAYLPSVLLYWWLVCSWWVDTFHTFWRLQNYRSSVSRCIFASRFQMFLGIWSLLE